MTLRPLTKLSNEPLDLLVIGGGIVGSGIVRDAAMRGLKTALVEQRDFAFGTSSRSTRLLHGGIRYLAQGRIGLVREASVEKRVLQHIAPHLAEPLAFVFPSYPDTDWPLWQLRVGVKIYDMLCGGKNFGESSVLSKEEALKVVPCLNPVNLHGAVRYFDGFTNDARLVLDTLRSAAAHGAILLNYCKFQEATRERDGWCCEIREEESSRTCLLRSKVVVNATGPWAAQFPQSAIRLRLTKGIHLVVRRDRLPVSDAVVLTSGKRILFAIPWGERVILGTTDTDYAGSLDEIRAVSEDIDYMLEVAAEFFPGAHVSRSDVISTWAGLRPLISDARGSASDISRAHRILNPVPGWWDVAGGKLTTYRLIAEQALDRIASEERWRLPKCPTAEEPLLTPGETTGVSGMLPPDFNKDLVTHYCANEWALHLDDVMIRRTSWHYYDRDAFEKAAEVAEWMGEFLGWRIDEKTRELNSYRATFPSQPSAAKMSGVAFSRTGQTCVTLSKPRLRYAVPTLPRRRFGFRRRRL